MKMIFEMNAENGTRDTESETEDTSVSKHVHIVLQRFKERTSMHGCGYIMTSRHRLTKLFWAFLTVVAIIVLIVHLYMIVSEFTSWPRKTTVSLGFSNLRFPAVTICNVNVFKKSALSKYQGSRLVDLISAVDPDSLLSSFDEKSPGTASINEDDAAPQTEDGDKKRSAADLYASIDWTHFENDSDVGITSVTSQNTEDIDEEWNADRTALSLLWDLFRYLYMRISREDRATAGHNITDMLIECSFNGRVCYAGNFTLYQTASYGNCYTIDSKKMMSKRPGPDGGLSLLLYLQTDEFIQGISNGYGARVIVHEPGTKPLPDDEGVFIRASSETDIALKKTVVSRLTSPYGHCENGNTFKEEFGFNYSVKVCHVACLAKHIWNTCDCWYFMHEMIALQSNDAFNMCNTPPEIKCQANAMRSYYKKKLQCRCDNPCLDIQYTLSISGRQWPSEAYAAILKEGVCLTNPRECVHIRTYSSSQSLGINFVNLNIYYETLNYESIVEEPLIAPFTFLSSIGGALGLWIGLSMLSVCEVLQLAVEIVRSFITKLKESKMKK